MRPGRDARTDRRENGALASAVSIARQAGESLLAHPLRSLLTALSVTFGAAVLFVFLGYASGVPDATTTVLRSLGSKELLVEGRRSRGGSGGNRSGRSVRIRYADLATIREACPTVAALSPAYNPGHGGPVFAASRTWPWARLSGVGYDYATVTDMLITSGRWFTKEEELRAENVCLLSRPLVEGMFEGRSPLGQPVDAQAGRFETIGVFESNDRFAYSMIVPYPTAMEMGEGGGRYVSHLAFLPHRPGLARAAVSEMREVLGSLYSFDPADTSALDITENTAFVEQVEATGLALEGLLLVIALLALVLGCLGAANVVGIAVAERTSELGLRKALGATSSRIRTEVLAETLLLCLAGGALGVALGALATRALGPLEFSEQTLLVPRVDRTLLALAASVLVVTAVLAGLPAAHRAARLDPATALRVE